MSEAEDVSDSNDEGDESIEMENASGDEMDIDDNKLQTEVMALQIESNLAGAREFEGLRDRKMAGK